MSQLDFYFDFLSPYGYFAAMRIDDIAKRHGMEVSWRPFRLGVAVVKVMGLKPNMQTPLKAPYIRQDIARLAQVLGLPLNPPERLLDPLPPALLFYGAPVASQPDLAKRLFAAYWGDGRDVSSPEVLVTIGASIGMSEDAVRAALNSAECRQKLTQQTNDAIEKGVFGSPTFHVSGESFWGVDRMWVMERFLRHGNKYLPMTGAELSTYF
jgi:2-hydroxychromene-2-carboxylate isomerase